MSKHLTVGWLRKVLESYQDDQELNISIYKEEDDDTESFAVTEEPIKSPIEEMGDTIYLNFDADQIM